MFSETEACNLTVTTRNYFRSQSCVWYGEPQRSCRMDKWPPGYPMSSLPACPQQMHLTEEHWTYGGAFKKRWGLLQLKDSREQTSRIWKYHDTRTLPLHLQRPPRVNVQQCKLLHTLPSLLFFSHFLPSSHRSSPQIPCLQKLKWHKYRKLHLDGIIDQPLNSPKPFTA